MATKIRASCAECGDVELRVEDVTVRICAETDAGTYVFRCPRCRLSEVKDAEPRIVDLLLASGVELQTWSLPSELFEAKGGPAFTHEDLLDFHHILADDAWYEVFFGSAVESSDPNGPGAAR